MRNRRPTPVTPVEGVPLMELLVYGHRMLTEPPEPDSDGVPEPIVDDDATPTPDGSEW